MPLEPGSGRSVISRNIVEMQNAGHPHAQAVATALHNADKTGRSHLSLGGMPMMHRPMTSPGMSLGRPAIGGGMRPHLALGGGFTAPTSIPFYERNEARQLNDSYHPGGLFSSDVAGRTDRLPHSVAADSFVLPADVISSLGQGNTLAGAKIMDGILSSGAPYGASMPRTRRADGGGTGQGLSHVMVAGGEYSIPPWVLKDVGRRRRGAKMSKKDSDLGAGHEWAREFVDKVRKEQKKFLANAPKPKK